MFYKQICFLFFSADPDLIFLVSELDVVSPIRIIEFLLYFFFFFWEGRALVRINCASSDKPNLRPNILRLFQYSFLVLESPGALKGWSFVTIFFVLTIITICKIKEKKNKRFSLFLSYETFCFLLINIFYRYLMSNNEVTRKKKAYYTILGLVYSFMPKRYFSAA